jgi:hypothetical protein
VCPAQYDGEVVEGAPMDGAPMDGGAPCYDGAGGGMMYAGPRGMPTAGFSPQIAPPNVYSGVNGPQWGMPITGTPIGLPGPPHIPLGHQAGLMNHTMKNRTRVMLPPPVHKMTIDVKQRPGMDYPRPVNHVDVAEVNRAPFRLFGGTVPPLWQSLFHHKGDGGGGDCPPESCPPEEYPQ